VADFALVFCCRSCPQDEVSSRSLSLCCELLSLVCQTAVEYCDDALESHLQVIVATLTAQVTERSAISQQVRENRESVKSQTSFKSQTSAEVLN